MFSFVRKLLVATPTAFATLLGLTFIQYSGSANATALPNPTCSRPAAEPEIAALARALKYDLSLIYEYVYYDVDYSPTWGSKKGALGTYLDHRGNNIDQNVLFVELLRQSCITANYRSGSVNLPTAAVANMLGVQNDVQLVSTTLGNGGFSGNVTAQTTTLNLVWTEATVNGTTYELDPSFKSYAASTPIDLATAMGYSKTTLLSAAAGSVASGVPAGVNSIASLNGSQLSSTLNQYAQNLANYLKANKASSSTKQVFGGRDITSDYYGSTYPATGTLYTSLPSTLETVYTVTVSNNADGSSPLITKTLYASQISGKRLTLTYNAQSQPQLMLDGTLLGTGAAVSVPTQTVSMTVQHPYPAGANYATYVVRPKVKTGGAYALMLAAGEWGRDRLTRHQKNLALANQKGQVGTIAAGGEPGTGEGLAAIGTAYLTQSDRISQFYANYLGFNSVRHAAMGIAGQNAAAYVDFPAQTNSLSQGKVGQTNNDLAAAAQGINVLNSTLESTAVTQLQRNPAVSTVRMFDYANRDATGFVEATASNWASVKPLLRNWSATDLDAMGAFLQAHAANGQVMVPLNGTRVVGNWKGSGYYQIDRATSSMDMGYLISGGYSGGYASNASYSYLNPTVYSSFATAQQALPNPVSAEPIDLQNGNYTYEHKDLDVGNGEYPFSLALTRSYSSGSSTQTTELGSGWRHNFMLSANIDSDSYEAYGDHNAMAALPLAVSAYVLKDLSSDARPVLKNVVIGSLAASWMMDQLVDNAVTLTLDQGTKKFIRLPSGAYVAPPGDASTLVVNSDKTIVLTDKTKVVYTFDADGKIAQWKDPNGNTVTFTYSGSGASKLLQSVSNGMGRTLTFTYASGKLASVSNGSSSVSYTYSGNQLTNATDRLGKATRYTYDASGLLVSIYWPSFPNTAAVTNVYDALGRIKTQADAYGNVWTYLFANGRRSEEIDPTGASRGLYYDANGNHIEDIDQVGNHTVFVYDGVGRPVRTIYPAGDSEVVTYDASSNVLTKATNPIPGAIDTITGIAATPLVQSWTYQSTFNKPLTQKDARGYITSYAYDARGNLTSLTQPSVPKPGSTAKAPVTSYVYNARGQVTQVTDPEGRVTANTYDSANGNLLTTVTDSGRLNLSTAYAYDTVGNLARVTDPTGAATSYTYDAARQRTVETPPSIAGRTQTAYDADGRVVTVQRETGNTVAPWSTTTTVYLPNDKVSTVTGPDGTVKTTTYDTVGRVATETSKSGRRVAYTYDAASRVITVTDQVSGTLDSSITRNLGSVVREQRTYYNTGGLATLKDGKSNTLTTYYDGFKRAKQLIYPDGRYELHGFDANGNEQVTQNRSGQLTWYTFDALNRMDSKAPDGQTKLTYGYDYSGRRLTANGAFNLTFGYDTAGRAVSEGRSDLSTSLSWTLDANGRRKTTTWPGSYSTTAAYDSLGRLTDVCEGATTSGTRLGHYTYDLLSQRTTINYGPGTARSTVVGWTTGGQIAQLDHTWIGGNLSLGYTYNLDHQRKTLSTSDTSFLATSAATSQTYTVNALNQYLTVSGKGMIYDTRGNLTSDGTWTYGYDVENHLVSASKAGTTATYAYDALGRRSSKTVNGVTTYFLSQGDQEVADYNTNKQLVARYVYGAGLDEPLVMVLASGVRYYHVSDALGSTVALLSDSGSLTEKYAYTAYGQGPSSSATPFLYAGRRIDPETGLYHNRARAYSPVLGRFLQADPIGTKGGINLYAYVQNDPLNAVDPSGHGAVGLGLGGDAKAFGGGVSGSGQLVFAWRNGDFWDTSHWQLGVVASGGAGASTHVVPGAGLSVIGSFAPGINSIDQFGGTSAAVGGSANLGLSVGFERSNICTGCEPVYNVSVGPALKVIPAELHTSVTKSWTGTLLGGDSTARSGGGMPDTSDDSAHRWTPIGLSPHK